MSMTPTDRGKRGISREGNQKDHRLIEENIKSVGIIKVIWKLVRKGCGL